MFTVHFSKALGYVYCTVYAHILGRIDPRLAHIFYLTKGAEAGLTQGLCGPEMWPLIYPLDIFIEKHL
jgi:hypothetical protein